MPWCTVWIFLFDAVVESHFFYGALNLYVMGVMMEESCSTTRHWGKNMFAMLLCLRQSRWARVAGEGWHLYSDEGKNIYLICVTHSFFIIWSYMWRTRDVCCSVMNTGCRDCSGWRLNKLVAALFLRSYSNACINVVFYHFTHECSLGNLSPNASENMTNYLMWHIFTNTPTSNDDLTFCPLKTPVLAMQA